MQNDPSNETPLKLKPHRGSDLSTLFISAAIGYVVTLIAPLFAGLIISCLLLILLSRLRNRLHQPLLWWSSIGLCSGSFQGTALSFLAYLALDGSATSSGWFNAISNSFNQEFTTSR